MARMFWPITMRCIPRISATLRAPVLDYDKLLDEGRIIGAQLIRRNSRYACKFPVTHSYPSMQTPYLLLAITIGAGVAVQAGLNAQLRNYVGHPMFAALVNFLVGTLCLIGLLLVLRVPWPAAAAIKQAPVWLWLGGMLGAFYVASAVLIAPKLGAGVMFALLIAGQVAMSLILDHYGWIGFPQHPLGFWRLVGGALLVVGVVLVVQN